MKVKSFYIGLGLLLGLHFLPGHAMMSEHKEEGKEINPNCQVILQKIKTTKETLDDYKSQNGKIPLSEPMRYEEYLKDLLQLYTRAKNGEEMNVKEELFFLSEKYF